MPKMTLSVTRIPGAPSNMHKARPFGARAELTTGICCTACREDVAKRYCLTLIRFIPCSTHITALHNIPLFIELICKCSSMQSRPMQRRCCSQTGVIYPLPTLLHGRTLLESVVALPESYRTKRASCRRTEKSFGGTHCIGWETIALHRLILEDTLPRRGDVRGTQGTGTLCLIQAN